MKTLRAVVTLLLCLALPLQGYAALRLAATPCPAMHHADAGTHEGHVPAMHDGCQPMPCCQDQHKDQLPGPGCGSCVSCTLTAFMSPDIVPAASHHAHVLRAQRGAPALHTLDLSAIWRPPSNC